MDTNVLRRLNHEINKKEMVELEMESKDFDSLMFYLKQSGDKIVLEDIDAKKASDMYHILRSMNK